MAGTGKLRQPSVGVTQWRPPGAYPLALEVMSLAQLRQRAPAEQFERTHRIEFYSLMVLTRGRGRHMIDFETIDARAGSWLLLRPGQIKRFDFSSVCEGWNLIFRPDLLPSAARHQRAPLLALAEQVDSLPHVLRPPPDVHRIGCALLERMRADAALPASVEQRNTLLVHELGALIARLRLHAMPASRAVAAIDRERVARLRALVAAHAAQRRTVDWYAAQLACSAKTLQRALQQTGGGSLKSMIDARLALEAQRRLAHTAEPIKRIADTLGFADLSNFVKFFKRTTGNTPLEFRRQQGL